MNYLGNVTTFFIWAFGWSPMVAETVAGLTIPIVFVPIIWLALGGWERR